VVSRENGTTRILYDQYSRQAISNYMVSYRLGFIYSHCGIDSTGISWWEEILIQILLIVILIGTD